MAYSVYSFVSQYADTGQIGVYVGTREDNLGEALAIAAEQIADIAAGNLPERELDRAKENLKGRILLSMESTSTRMNRLGKSLITDSEILSLDRIVAEIDAVEAASVCELAAALLAPERLSAAVHRPERGALPRGARAGHADARARRVNDRPERAARGQGRRGARPGARGGRPRARRRARPTPRRWSTSRARTPSWRTSAAVEAGVPCVVGTTRLGRRSEVAARAPVPVFYAPNFALGAVLMMRFAAEAVRHFAAAEIVELHHETKLDAPSGTAKLTAERMGGDVPIHSVRLPGLVAHQEVILGGRGETAHDPPRHDLARGVRAGRAARARAAVDAAAGRHRRARRTALTSSSQRSRRRVELSLLRPERPRR